MPKKILASFLIIALLLSGCAPGLNSVQQRQYDAYEADGVLVREKSPGVGVALGFLPGIGSFYAREPGIGIINFLLWPISIFWDPVSGHRGAKSINYHATKYKLKRDQQRELSALDSRFGMGVISQKQYFMEKNRIDQKYDYE